MAEAQQAKQHSPKVTEILDRIGEFTLMELSELVEAFEDRFNVQAQVAAPVAVAASGAAAAAEEEQEEEPTEFEVAD